MPSTVNFNDSVTTLIDKIEELSNNLNNHDRFRAPSSYEKRVLTGICKLTKKAKTKTKNIEGGASE